MPNADQALGIAKALGRTVEFLLEGENSSSLEGLAQSRIGPPLIPRDAEGQPVDVDGDVFVVPILGQTVAAGHGQ
ncbi:MAG TPA: hypothetical protein VMC79_03210, partial [Rectinemataceae bacterium]|nr:hypothetical protein [Rectinemataceae bacterium]